MGVMMGLNKGVRRHGLTHRIRRVVAGLNMIVVGEFGLADLV